ncbi:hypothetical protein [Conexibacter woesei]|uniref:hypothetical protein n=1 Tax=Conexibacter woesei TaxID=191495 RepID=UPI00041B551C|nr:hypothetical protein [Conexibacter woesei]
MHDGGREHGGGESGQASIEFVALLPLLLAAALVLLQLLVVGVSAWLASTAARDAARASALGTDPRRAAVTSLPAPFRRHLTVTTRAPSVHINLRIPTLTGIGLGSLSATASMESQR